MFKYTCTDFRATPATRKPDLQCRAATSVNGPVRRCRNPEGGNRLTGERSAGGAVWRAVSWSQGGDAATGANPALTTECSSRSSRTCPPALVG